MKRKVLMVVLPVAAGLALAGTGFGAWVFSNNVYSANAGANINITTAVNITGLKVVMEEDTITLDQNVHTTDGDGYEGKMTAKFHFEVEGGLLNGIADKVDNSVTGFQNVSTQNVAGYTTTDITPDPTKTYTIRYAANYNFTLTKAAAFYLDDPDGDAGTNIGDPSLTELTASAATTDYATMTYTHDGSEWVVSAEDLTDPKEMPFTWKDGYKPTTAEAYTAMVNAFKSDENKGSIVMTLSNFKVFDVKVA